MVRSVVCSAAFGLALVLPSPAAFAHQAHTRSVAGFSANPVSEGTPVLLQATVSFTGTFGAGPAHSPLQQPGDPVGGDVVHFQMLAVSGVGVACGTAGAGYVGLGSASTNASGVATLATPFDTTGLGGRTVGFRVLHPTGGPPGPHRYAQSTSECTDLVITHADPLPDGAVGYTQGYFGSSPEGEALVASLVDAETCLAITTALEATGVPGATDCSDAEARAALAFLLTGPVGPGPERPRGFLPSGFAPGQNLVAQLVALLLNLELGAVLPDGEQPLAGAWFLNVDPILDLVDGVPAGWVDPIVRTGGALGSCVDAAPADSRCDGGSVLLSALGQKAAALDAAGTTVDDVVAAAFALLVGGADAVELRGVPLERGELTGLLGLLNESYDEGDPTGFVTAFDAD